MNKRAQGTEYEKRAGEWLRSMGFEILACNFRCRFGEIDLVAMEKTSRGAVLVFVEVKYRADTKRGFPEEAVHFKKQRVISKTARFFLLSHHFSEEQLCRFDVVSICGDRFKLIRNAFPFRE